MESKPLRFIAFFSPITPQNRNKIQPQPPTRKSILSSDFTGNPASDCTGIVGRALGGTRQNKTTKQIRRANAVA
jgi:hypothetical protein